MSHSIKFLLSNEAVSGRKARRDGYASDHSLIGGDLLFVCHMETSRGMVELDASDIDHANNMVAAWIKNGMAQTAAIRRVYDDGSIGKIIGKIFDGCDYHDYSDDLDPPFA